MQLTARPPITGITETSNVFQSIPRRLVCSSALACQMLLRPAGSSVIAIVWACGTLTSNTIITGEARAGASLAIAAALVGALRPGVHIVGIHHLTDPGKVTRASALRTIRSSPLILSIKTLETLAIVV